jgi:hypothetical protein
MLFGRYNYYYRSDQSEASILASVIFCRRVQLIVDLDNK